MTNGTLGSLTPWFNVYMGTMRRLTLTSYALSHGRSVVPSMLKDRMSQSVVSFCPFTVPWPAQKSVQRTPPSLRVAPSP